MPKKSPIIKPGSSDRKRHLPDPRTVTVVPTAAPKWPILLVDDEPEIHRVTEMALDGVTFDGRPLELIKAFSAKDAREILEKRLDIAAAIVDVVMETEHAGLDLVEWIRTILGNTNIRIVLRTGQPGQAPERNIITQYDINDYKEKTELTARKMHTLVISCLRSWRDIKALETNRLGLDLILKGTGPLFSYQAADRFAGIALKQFHALIHAYDGTDSDHIDGFVLSIKRRTGKATIMTGYGRYNIPEGSDLNLFPDIKADIEALEHKIPANGHVIAHDGRVMARFSSSVEDGNILFLDHVKVQQFPEQSIIDVFCQNMAYALSNFHLINLVEQTQREVVQRLGEAIETRSADGRNHVRRVAEYSFVLALASGMSERDAQVLYAASPLHDVGKIVIPDAILNKPGRLTDREWALMKEHTLIGEEMLIESELEILKCAAIITGAHHENWDGTGYPRKLSGKSIPLPARITTIADVFDSLACDNPYRKAWPIKDILAYFEAHSGTLFDPSLVAILFDKLPELLEARSHHSPPAHF